MSNLLYVNDLIDRTLKTVRAASSLQDTDQGDREDVLNLLNEILSEFNATGQLLPFQISQTFPIEAGKGKYVIGRLIGATFSTTPYAVVEYVDLIIDGIRFPVTIIDDFAVLGHGISLVNQARPGWVRITRNADANILEFYQVPDQDYTCQIFGKKEIGNVAFQDTIDLPLWYARYLRLAIARETNDYFALQAWDEIKERKFEEARTAMLAAAQKDLAIQTDPPFKPGPGIRTYNLGVVTR
jgi:hypothetical protein